MKLSEIIVLSILFTMLFTSLLLLWINLPAKEQEFTKYNLVLDLNLTEKSMQFYPNMRYPDRKISYSISEQCSKKRAGDFVNAVKILENKTILSFYPTNYQKAQIIVTCSNLPIRSEERGHFVAGEGGPSRILNGSRFSIILEGKVALYRPETCDKPNIAIHELLHALGFDHNNNSLSIMYPITDCKQQIDSYIIEEINRLYSIESRADLAIEKVSANKTGRYLSFEIVISNIGLKDSSNLTLNVIAKEKYAKSFTIEGLEIGTKRILTVSNLRIPIDTEKITFEIVSTEKEISNENNVATLSLIKN